MSNVILFNFNGTIVKTKSVAIHIFNEIAKKRGYQIINNEDIQFLSTLSIRNRCKRLGVPIYEMPIVGMIIKKRYQQYIPKLDLADGLNEAIQELKERGYRLAFITTNSSGVTEQFLNNNSINCFDFRYYCFNPFSKKTNISSFLKEYTLDPSEVIYIGDELRDIKAANQNRLYSIAAAWGYDSIDLLATGHADHIAQRPKDILNIVSRF